MPERSIRLMVSEQHYSYTSYDLNLYNYMKAHKLYHKIKESGYINREVAGMICSFIVTSLLIIVS